MVPLLDFDVFSFRRSLIFGVIIAILVLLFFAIVSIISFALGHKEPMGVIRIVLDVVESIYRLPVFWVQAPYTTFKNIVELCIEIIVWGAVFECCFRYFISKIAITYFNRE